MRGGRSSRLNGRGGSSFDSISKWRLLVILSFIGVGALLFYRWHSGTPAFTQNDRNINTRSPPEDLPKLRNPLDPRSGLPIEDFSSRKSPNENVVEEQDRPQSEVGSPKQKQEGGRIPTDEPDPTDAGVDSSADDTNSSAIIPTGPLEAQVEELALEKDDFPDVFPPRNYKKGDTVFFIHIPKTAGFTFRRILQQFISKAEAEQSKKPNPAQLPSSLVSNPSPGKEGGNSTNPPNGSALPNPPARQRGPMQRGRKTCVVYCSCREGLGMTHIAHKDIVTGCSMVSGHFDYSNKILLREAGFEKTGEILTVTMLRHPIKRIISEYHFIMERMKRHPVTVANMSMYDYVSSYLTTKKLDNLMVRIMAGAVDGHSLMPKSHAEHIRSSPELMLELAKRHLRSAKYFGLMDRWNESLDLLRYSFGWRMDEPLEKVYSFHVMPKKKPPPESMLQLITDVNQLDLAFYEWAVPLYEKRVAQMRNDPNWLKPRQV